MKALVIGLVVLLAVLVAVDRIAVAVAQGEVAERVAAEAGLGDEPDVQITGFPFLTQVVGGRYDDVLIRLDATDLDQPAGTRADIHLRGVELPLSDAVSGSVARIPVERIDGVALLPYDLLAEAIGPGTSLERDGDQVAITRSVDLLGQQAELTAAGQVTLDGDQLVIDVENASAAGVDVPAAVVSAGSDLLALRYDLPQLPFGLELTGVAPAAQGVEVSAESPGAVLGS
jgi:LmeA-like phospholipid-binding